MDAIFGADLLTNPKIAQAEQVNLNLPELSSIELPEFNSAPSEEPKLMPSLNCNLYFKILTKVFFMYYFLRIFIDLEFNNAIFLKSTTI